MEGIVRVLPEDVESDVVPDPRHVPAEHERRGSGEKNRGAAVGRELAEDEPDLRANDHEDPGDAEVGIAVDPGLCRGDLTEGPKETERRGARNKDLRESRKLDPSGLA